MSIEKYIHDLEQLRASGRYRSFTPLSGRNGCYILCEGKKMLNLTSNDYLGIAGDKDLYQEFLSGIEKEDLLSRYGFGATSSRLLTGDNPITHELEESLCHAYKKEACLLFNSGYHANIGILPALLDKNDLVLSDKLNHASIVDGMRLSRAEHKRYRHGDLGHLAFLLEKYRSDFDAVIIVSESVFSMDGDVADLPGLVELKKRYNCLLYLDEAHAVGLYGLQGLGKAEEYGVLADIDLLVGTFGKAFGSIGAYLLCSSVMRDFLTNHSRSLIFTTALPPIILAWNKFILSVILKSHQKRSHLQSLAKELRQCLCQNSLVTAGATNIVPVMLGDNLLSVKMAATLRELGYLIFPVRPPTVPEGTARFRLSLTADMVWEDLENLAGQIASEKSRLDK